MLRPAWNRGRLLTRVQLHLGQYCANGRIRLMRCRAALFVALSETNLRRYGTVTLTRAHRPFGTVWVTGTCHPGRRKSPSGEKPASQVGRAERTRISGCLKPASQVGRAGKTCISRCRKPPSPGARAPSLGICVPGRCDHSDPISALRAIKRRAQGRGS